MILLTPIADKSCETDERPLDGMTTQQNTMYCRSQDVALQHMLQHMAQRGDRDLICRQFKKFPKHSGTRVLVENR